MKIALLNEKIIIQKAVMTSDSIGNHKNAWEDYIPVLPRLVGKAEMKRQKPGRRWMKSV